MPQIFQVLRCYQCLVFQVQQRKKTNKFECKLCGEKQSIKRFYGLGTAKECRQQVQKLNLIRGEMDEEKFKNMSYTSSGSDEEVETKIEKKPAIKTFRPNKSKWSDFVEETDDTPDMTPNETMYLDNSEVVLEVPKKRFRGKFKAPTTPNTGPKVPSNFQFGETSVSTSVTSLSSRAKAREPHEPIFLPNNITIINETATVSEPTTTVSTQKRESKLSKKFVPPPVNKNSKWAQFAQPGSSSSDIVQHPQQLFSLCNDEDLDNVLFMY